MSKSTASPAASGPAGADFEAKVGATYMLAMLRGAEPRGLPSTVFDRVELQRAAEGHPLDDVIIHAHDKNGAAAILEIQVKRAITFAPQDEVFKEVVAQIATAIQKPEFRDGRYELAIATAQTTRAITGSYQEVLNQARKINSPDVFFDRLAREGSANDSMRAFVATLRANLEAAGAAHDDNTVYQVLRHLQIHVYDFTAPASDSEHYARDRAADLLHPEAKGNAGGLWEALIAHTLALSASGGDATRQTLISHLQKDFRLAGERQYAIIRGAIAEAADQALADIVDRVGEISLNRLSLVNAVRAATDIGRFVEIRGDAGVGKSGLLKHFAEEAAQQGRILVLAPGRIPKRGWSTMRAQFSFDGTAQELLSDLASDGGTWIFIDNLDSFDAEERTTVNDLVRAAAAVPGVTVIATARQRFGVDEPSWLPTDAQSRFGGVQTVAIGDLTDDEIEELREAEPQLHALLAREHPARAVARNLFRLARLMATPGSEPTPRSEIDMAELWWRTGGSGPDTTLRERGRALRDLATRSLAEGHVFDATLLDAGAVDALIRNESLRDFGNDRVAFSHDVLREWAIANILVVSPDLLSALPINETASPSLARGLELAARFLLERNKDPAAWHRMLDSVSNAGAHPSWRRAVLLATVHSEIAAENISVLAGALLADNAKLLRELIPIMIAVDVRSVRDVLASFGIDTAMLPDAVSVPMGQGWYAIVSWLLSLGSNLPLAALSEIVDLLAVWLTGNVLGPTFPLTDQILRQFKAWLIEIQKSDDYEYWHEQRSVFDGAVSGTEVKRIEEALRTNLALFANRAPDVAKEYLQSVQARKRKDRIYQDLLKFRGSLAQAAPEEVAAITLEVLVRPNKDMDERRRQHWSEDAFTHFDSTFAPASPAQGPFHELLVHAPQVGLQLIRTLIESAITYHTKGRVPANDDAFVVEFPDGPRRFVWQKTYGWSRSSHYSAITSALMALETWAHARIEGGESVEAVLADVTGDHDDIPAAYLLVVVDILLSHWPESRVAAVPYVACPELLSFDLGRPVQENAKLPDIFGLEALHKEPAGPKLADLKKRVSRRVSLERLLYLYATGEDWGDLREQAETLLRKAAERLGPHEAGDSKREPRLMAFHALNLLNPANYVDVEHENANGEVIRRKQYVSPEAEAEHFKPLEQQAEASGNNARAIMIVNALVDHPELARPEIAEWLATWAHSSQVPDDEDGQRAFDQTNIGAAMIVMRDGSRELRDRYGAWAEDLFAKVFEGEPDHVSRMREGMLYNIAAMAFAGRVFAAQDKELTRDDYRRLLDMAAFDACVARGVGAVAAWLRKADARLPRAIMRVGFAKSICLWQSYEVPEAEKEAASAELKGSVHAAIEAEVRWLLDGASEPPWPKFPIESVRTRQRRRIRIGAPSEPYVPPSRETSRRFVDHQAAALWLEMLATRAPEDRLWLSDFQVAYAPWTYSMNGAGLDDEDEVSETPDEWNREFFAVITSGLAGQNSEAANRTIAPIFDLPEKQFYDVMATFLRSLDVAYFNESTVSTDVALAVRTRFAEKLASTYGWQRLRGSRPGGVEIHLAPAVATLFFSDHLFGQPPKCYLLKNAVVRSLGFTPLFEQMAKAGASVFVGMALLNWADVDPHVDQMPAVLTFGMAAIDAYPNDRAFWVDYGMGRRICKWLQNLHTIDPAAFMPEAPHRATIDQLLARLVAIGIVEARDVELELQKKAS